MIEYTSRIDVVLSALSDPVRRDIFERTAQSRLTVNEIAVEYDISLAAVSKHLSVLEVADLITRRKSGRYVYVSAHVEGLREAQQYIEQFISSGESAQSIEVQR